MVLTSQDSGAMRTGWYKEGSTWYYLKRQWALWQQDGQLQMVNGLYFEKSGAMVADRAVPASDGESYVIGKDGYLANRKDAGYNIHDIVKLGDGQEIFAKC